MCALDSISMALAAYTLALAPLATLVKLATAGHAATCGV
jgi:hypothetical protein